MSNIKTRLGNINFIQLHICLFVHQSLDGAHDMEHHLLLVVTPDDLNPQGAALSAPARLPGQPEVGVSVGVVSLQRRLVIGALPGHR